MLLKLHCIYKTITVKTFGNKRLVKRKAGYTQCVKRKKFKCLRKDKLPWGWHCRTEFTVRVQNIDAKVCHLFSYPWERSSWYFTGSCMHEKFHKYDYSFKIINKEKKGKIEWNSNSAWDNIKLQKQAGHLATRHSNYVDHKNTINKL